MTSNKKLKLFIWLADMLGVSVDDIVSYREEIVKLKQSKSAVSTETVSPVTPTTVSTEEMPPVASTTASSPEYQTPASVLPGMYVYTDGLIYPEIIEGRQIKAVVGYVDGSEVLAVCLKERKLPWGPQRMSLGEPSAYDWCGNYREDGVERGSAFLATAPQLKRIAESGEVINASLRALPETAMELDGWYWSDDADTEYGCVSIVHMPKGGVRMFSPFGQCKTRPIIKITL